jgi:Bacterial Ig-like domain (group 3)
MRLNRPLGVASNPEPGGGHRAGAGVARALSVAALAAAACALSALPALAASAAPAATGTAAASVTITSPNPTVAADAGVAVPLTATVASDTGGAVPTGTVTFVPQNVTPYAAIECTVGLNAAGTGTCNVTPPTGTWGFILYEAQYSGDATYAPQVSTGEHKVITWDITSTALTFNPSPATEGKPVTLTATVTDEPGKALADAGGGPDQVTFSIGGTAIPGCSNVNVTDPSDGPDNVATCTYTPTATGSVSIEAAYLGDDYALASSATETLTVNPATRYTTKTAVSVSPKTAPTKTLVTLSAKITASGGPTPTGTVTFWVSTRKLCVATLSGGKASCKAAFPNAGPKTIVGDYSGSSTDEASSGSAPLTITKS